MEKRSKSGMTDNLWCAVSARNCVRYDVQRVLAVLQKGRSSPHSPMTFPILDSANEKAVTNWRL